MKDFEKKIRAYALKNALAHDGKAVQGAVISALFHEGLKKDEVGKYIKNINEIIKEINKLSIKEQEKEFEKAKSAVSERPEREGLPELPDVKKPGVIMRFRPAPSGPLHVGHIIANLASSLYVEKYGGKFYIIIDDTDPETVLADAYKKIKEDCDWIFGNVFEYINSSDRMKIYYDYAESLIKKGKSYVCICSQEKFKGFSENQINCPCRDNNIKENMERWNKMLDKSGYKEGQAVLRFKSNMQDINPAMRDFPLARINEKPHPKQGKKYRVWPLMNLVVAVDDMELGMTHIIRGKDHRDNALRQEKIFQVFNKTYPWVFFIGRIKFTDLVLSKRKITSLIKAGEFSGADDERLPTISSLKKRGYKREAFVKFIEQRGLTEVDKVISGKDFFEVLDNFNKL
jgi:glutamyl-tRNA synthetase